MRFQIVQRKYRSFNIHLLISSDYRQLFNIIALKYFSERILFAQKLSGTIEDYVSERTIPELCSSEMCEVKYCQRMFLRN